MKKISSILFVVSFIGIIICLTLMFAGVWYGFSGEPWVNGFVACAAVNAACICIICKDIDK